MLKDEYLVLSNSQSKEFVKIKLTQKQLRSVAQKLHIAPLTEAHKSQIGLGEGEIVHTEKRNKSLTTIGKGRKPLKRAITPNLKRPKSKLEKAILNFGPDPSNSKRLSMPKWIFREESSKSSQKTPKFKYKKEAPAFQLSLSDITAASQDDTQCRQPLFDSFRQEQAQELPSSRSSKAQLQGEIQDLEKQIYEEIKYQDSENAVPLASALPAPLILHPDLLSSYTHALEDIQRMRYELATLKSKEENIMELNSRLKDTISLQQRRNEVLRLRSGASTTRTLRESE